MKIIPPWIKLNPTMNHQSGINHNYNSTRANSQKRKLQWENGNKKIKNKK